ncbi:SemiSWEET family transporter [Limosilactobacillus caccae]|jgi:uncharacterized protein with PQ loop repeat|uniref:SemiSWEET family transporter n=1 Tax=Limosilactobacillus caccae TaxID=1926284 RepID=UPI000970F665|nr:SemiSWEET family transporter [Limosilactobacillus caccae]
MDTKDLTKRLKKLRLVGNTASIACLLMYFSYFGQIAANLSGHPVSPTQPFFAAINATLWVVYGALKPQKDWPVIIANFPGIIFGLVTFITAII